MSKGEDLLALTEVPNILALDVGFAATGCAIFKAHNLIYVETIKTVKAKDKRIRKANDNADRARTLARGISRIIKDYQPALAVGEMPSGGAQSGSAMRAMGIALGVVSAVCEVHDIPALWTDPRAVKMAICGKANASKDEMMDTVRALYSGYEFPKAKNKFEHIADAIGALEAVKHDPLVKLIRG